MPFPLRFTAFSLTFLIATGNFSGVRVIKPATRTVDADFLDKLIAFESESASAILSASEVSGIYAPLGLHFVLSMLYSLSDGTAKTAFAETLGVDLETLEGQMPLLIDDLANGLTDYQMSNSIWYDNKDNAYEVSAFERLQPIYDALIFEEDFALEGPEKYAAFIGEQTKDFLEPSPSQFESMRQMTFANLNTLYFHGLWDRKFAATKTMDFVDAHGDVTSKNMMYKDEESMFYYPSETAKSVAMKYKDGSRMILIRPDDGYQTNDILGESGALKEIIDAFYTTNEVTQYVDVNIAMPAFTTSSSYILNAHVADLGLSTIFNRNTTNFAPMLTAETPFAIALLGQEAMIEVTAEGTTAAAATFSLGCSSAAPLSMIDFYLDKPFIYVIESATSIPMFVGTIQTVS